MEPSHPQSIRTLRLMGWVLLYSVFLYLLAGEFISRTRQGSVPHNLKNLLTLLALVMFSAVLMLRYRFMPAISRTANPADMSILIPRLRLVAIQGMVCSEAVALFGFVLRFLGASRNYTLPFYVLAAFGILLFIRALPIDADAVSR